MHDIRFIRENPVAFDAALARCGLAGMSGEPLAMDEARRAKILAAETARRRRTRHRRCGGGEGAGG